MKRILKMSKRIVAFALVSALALTTLGACGKTKKETDDPSAETSLDSALSDDVVDRSKDDGDVAGQSTGDEQTAGLQSKNGDIFKIGVVQFADHPSLDNCYAGFVEGLRDAGFVDGETIQIDHQSGQADTAITNQIVNSFVSQNYDLICGIATPAAQAAYNTGSKANIPVIFNAVTDPIAAELANSDGTNKVGVTGVSDALPIEQQLKMIRAFLPDAKTIGILYSTSETNSVSSLAIYEDLAPEYGFTIVSEGVNAAGDVPLAADQMLNKVDCVSNLTDNLVVQNMATIINKCKEKGIPYFGSEEEQVVNGCLAAEGLDYLELGRQTGVMAARVFAGETAEFIPFETIKDSQPFYNPAVLDELNLTVPADYADRIIDVSVKD
ncbi:MAG: ABC transporter substrate-binding protein [Fastidiosipilaceae bacterium]|jgi:putative ABC transport system substrate-binding protein